MTLGEKLKAARKEKKMTQRDVAKLIGASHTAISEWENDKHKPDADTIELLLGLYDISATDLFGNRDTRPNAKVIAELAFDADALEVVKLYRKLNQRSKYAIRSILEELQSD